MKKTTRRAAAFFAGLMLIPAAVSASFYESYLSDGTVPSIKERYAEQFEIGITAEAVLNENQETAEMIAEQCSLLICEELTRGKVLLDRGTSKKQKDPGHARLRIGKAAEALDFASEHGMKIRAATVIQPANIPEWFFNEEWAALSNAAKSDRETVILRMENAIRDQISQMNEKYPDLIGAWEVVCSNLLQEEDLFRETIGEEYLSLAFRTARETAAEDQRLLWKITGLPDGKTLETLKELKDQELVDGVVLACSVNPDGQEWVQFGEILQEIADAGFEIHLSDLEIIHSDRSAEGQIRLALRYKEIFALAEKTAVRSISFPALQDSPERKKDTPPRLINEKGRYTPAFFGALQDEIIPEDDSQETIHAAVEKMELETIMKKEADPVISYKKIENHNPVMTQRFGADPWAMVYGDRVYLYMTGDEPVMTDGDKPKTNDYSNIVTLRILSSEDLVNWTDHGSVRAAGRTGAAQWASNSWAPCAAWKNVDGQDKFFLYFANSGGGIGVLTADSPTGPFTDPIGKPLISRNTPTCASVTWLFDPAVLTDEDGSAYLYFGGGIPEGKQADPGTARVVKLGADMISLDGEPEVIRPPYLFEDSGINRFGDTYVYSYCTNFNVPASGSPQGFGSGEIVYMVSDHPMGPFTYAGRILKNPGFFFGVGGNNHHCMFSFHGQWYITYHAATIDKAMGWNAGYRSTFVDRLELTDGGLPAPSKGTTAGVEQLKTLDPYTATSGATAASMAGMTTQLASAGDKKAGTGPMAAVSTSPDGWTAVSGADFGADGAVSVRMIVRSEIPARIEIIPDSEENDPAAVLEIPACEENTEIAAILTSGLTGTHDLYFRFTESGVSMLEWQFSK